MAVLIGDGEGSSQGISSAVSGAGLAAHTPGPWIYQPNAENNGYGDPADAAWEIRSAEWTIASVITDVEELEAAGEANARLIAAAPELLEALERCDRWFRDYERQHRAKGTAEANLKADTNEERADYCRAAIAKALGSSTTEQSVPVREGE